MVMNNRLMRPKEYVPKKPILTENSVRIVSEDGKFLSQE